MYGDKLDLKFQETVEEIKTHESKVKLVGNGTWMDEPDLRKLYSEKPQRLVAILKNANRFTCETSETELIEDMSYVSKVSTEETH